MVNAQNSLFVCTIVAGRLIVTPAVEPRQSSSAETDQGMELLSANPTVEQPTVEADVTLPSQEDRGQEVVLAEPEKELPERHAADVAVEPCQRSSAETDQGMELLSANPTVEQPTVEVDVTLPSQEDRGQEVTVALAEPEKELPERHAADVAVEPRQSSSAEVDQGMEIPSVERGGLCRPRSVLWK